MPQENLSREFKVDLIKTVYNKETFDQIIAKANPYELSDIQEFLWDAALYVGRDEQGQPLSREAIIKRMMPTTDYWRSQLCGEPLDTCRGRSCFVSHPICAGNKLKGQIEVIRQFFDRRKQRAEQDADGLLMLMMYHINTHNYAAAGIYNIDRKPKITVGSRVLDGDSLRNVIQAMNVAVAQNYETDPMVRPIIIGQGRLNVHAKKVLDKSSKNEACILALTVPETEENEDLERVMKKMENGILRIGVSQN
jgi:hypothetical protein